MWRVSGFGAVQTVSVFCRISAFCHFSHLRFSVFTAMPRVSDPRVFRDDSREVRGFLNIFTGFLRFLSFFCTFWHFCDLRFSVFPVFAPMHRVRDPRVFCYDSREVRGFLKFFTRFCCFLSFFDTFCYFCDLRFSVSTPMHRVRDHRVFRDDSREVREEFLKFFTRFCRFLSFLELLDFDTLCCPSHLPFPPHFTRERRRASSDVQITPVLYSRA